MDKENNRKKSQNEEPQDNAKHCWEYIQSLLKGTLDQQIDALEKIFNHFNEFYPNSLKVIENMANISNPKEIRSIIAKKIDGLPLSTREYFSILKKLSEDPEFSGLLRSNKVLSFSALIDNPLNEVFSSDFQELMNQIERERDEFISKLNTTSPTLFSDQTSYFQELMNQIERERDEFISKLNTTSLTTDLFYKEFYSELGKPLTNIIDLNNISLEPLRAALDKTSSFYNQEDLAALKSVSKIPDKTHAQTLFSKLQECKPGRRDWNRYEQISEQILEYCLVPPLLEPIKQSITHDGIHKRDLIFHIPHGNEGFWTYITNRFGLAIIIDCKNYEKEIHENEIVITSKYFGKKKLTTLGIIVTRIGLSDGGKIGQKNEWYNNEKLILCFNDMDLMKMLQLKENQEDPTKIIDSKIRDFFMSL